jgi:hypothetical protein
MSQYNVVITYLPAGVYRNNTAAIIAKDRSKKFTCLRFGLLAGIRVGIPNLQNS